jgi:hypothetical protein
LNTQEIFFQFKDKYFLHCFHTARHQCVVDFRSVGHATTYKVYGGKVVLQPQRGAVQSWSIKIQAYKRKKGNLSFSSQISER